jgi:hypothetical protein
MDSITLSQGSVGLENRQHGRGSSWVLSVQGQHISFGSKEDAVMQCVLLWVMTSALRLFAQFVSTVYTAKWYYRTHRQRYTYISQTNSLGLSIPRGSYRGPSGLTTAKHPGNIITFSSTNISAGLTHVLADPFSFSSLLFSCILQFLSIITVMFMCRDCLDLHVTVSNGYHANNNKK